MRGCRGEEETVDKGEEELLTTDGGQTVIDLAMHAPQRMLRRWRWRAQDFATGRVAGHSDSTTPSPILPSPPLPSPPLPSLPSLQPLPSSCCCPSPAKRATHAVLRCNLRKDSPARTAQLSLQAKRGRGLGIETPFN